MGLLNWIKKKIRTIIMLFKEEKKVPIPTIIDSQKILCDKVILVVGGSGGIGQALAYKFLDSGAYVIIAGTDESKLKTITDRLNKSYPERIQYIIIDLLNIQSFEERIQAADKLFPDRKIEIIVNSAGKLNTNDFLHTTEAEFDEIMDLNLKGIFFFSQAIGQYMINNNIKGHILNVSSASALRPAWTPYQISKWGIRGFTLGLADTLLPYGIIVNAIAPGPVASAMLNKEDSENIYSDTSPSGRLTRPEEIANLAAFMVSDLGNMIIGDTFYMSGGSGTISLHK